MSHCGSSEDPHSKWLEKADLICQICRHDHEVNNIQVDLSEFLNFFRDDCTHDDLENILNSFKKLNEESQDIFDQMINIQKHLTNWYGKIKPKN